MKKIFLIAVLLNSLVVFSQNADPATNPTDCTNTFFKALLDEDADLMSKVLSDDFLLVSFDGSTINKSLISEAISGNYVVVETASVSGIRSRNFGENTAFVMGTWRAKGAIQGTGFDNEVVFGALCIKDLNGWHVANMQFTAVR